MKTKYHDEEQSQFEQGMVAFSLGYPKSLNPFTDKASRRNWFNGWYAAHDDFHELNNGGIW